MVRLLFPFLLFIVSLFSLPSLATPLMELPDDDATEDVREYGLGLQAVQSSDFILAERHFLNSLETNPRYVPSHLGLAHVYSNTGRHDRALAKIKGLYTNYPDNTYVLTSYGKYMVSEGGFKAAEVAFQKAVLLDERNVSLLMNLADFYMLHQQDNAQEAIAIYKKVLQLEPKNGGAQYALGVALAKTGDFTGAQKSLQQALANAPGNPLPLLMSAKLYTSSGETEKAREKYQQALNTDPNLLEAMLGIADLDAASGKSQKAIESYLRIAKKFPGSYQAYMGLGREYLILKKYMKARQAFLEATKRNASLALAYNNLAWIEVEHLKSSRQQAVSYAQDAVKLAPDVSEFLDTLGWAYQFAGESDKAIDALNSALGKDPANQSAAYHLGLVYLDKKSKQDARYWLQKAIELNSSPQITKDARAALKGN